MCVLEGIVDSPTPETPGPLYLCTLGFSSRKAAGSLPVLFVASFIASGEMRFFWSYIAWGMVRKFCFVLLSLRLLTRRPAFSLGGEKASAKRDLSGGNASLDARVAR